MKSSHPIQFRRELIPSPMLQRDGSGAFKGAAPTLEIRFDPLTGRTCRFVPYSLDRIIRPDIDRLVERSLEMRCPFCPPLVEEITPRFPPEIAPGGVIRQGRAMAFPNINPYDAYSAVIVVSDEHFIKLSEFTVATVLDALLAGHTYLKNVQQADPEAKHHFMAWNYLFPSGGSLIHPHIQCNAGRHPTNYQKITLEASQKYYEAAGTNFWQDLIEQERQAGERYIGDTGDISWLTSFAPMGRLSDVLAVFRGRASLTELSAGDLRHFAEGLLAVFRFMDELNLLSFNMATCSGFDGRQFWAHARITPRSVLLYSPIETSDQFYYQMLHDENICILPPEVACERLKRHFKR